MKKVFVRAFEIVKFMFDLIRTVLYLGVYICKTAVIGAGIFGAAFMIYKMYQLYIYLHITKSFMIPTTVIVLLIALVPVSGIATILYYIVSTAYYFVACLDYPLDSDNDVLLNIQKFMEDLKYKLVPGKKDQLAQKLGFKDMAEFENFDNSLSDSIGTYNKNDIEQFRKNNKN